MEVAHAVKFNCNTLAYLSQLEATLLVPGDVAECGVYRGQNTYHYANYLNSMGSSKRLFGFDSFTGLPKASIEKADLERFDNVDFSEVSSLLSGSKNVTLVPGFFERSFSDFSDYVFSCVILDCDLYESYNTCLNFFYPRLSYGGVVIFDEYFSKKYPLARRAVDEFFINKPEKPELFKKEPNAWERWRVVKR